MDDPAAHPARVVGDHPADRRRLVGGGIGAELAPVRSEDAVGVGQDGAWANPRQGPAVLDRDPGEVAPDVDHDAVPLRLPVEAGPAARRVTGMPLRRA